MKRLLTILLFGMTLTSCLPPAATYPYTPSVTNKRANLKDHLVALLPKEQQSSQAAHDEATWLADTAYKAAAGISRVNDSCMPGWFGNALINTRLQDRGLCWHYQHDMYRELRRRPLHFFRIGCCVRDAAERSEHNCIYIAAKGGEWPNAWMLDAWKYNGRLVVDDARTLNPKRWKDLPSVGYVQSTYYPEGHDRPIEFWSVIRGPKGDYQGCFDEGSNTTGQYRRMYENIQRGMLEHPGTPTNY